VPERLFNTYQVADLLGKTPGTVLEWMKKGLLPFERLGEEGPARISEKSLIQFLEQHGGDIEAVMAKLALRGGNNDPQPAGKPPAVEDQLPPGDPLPAAEQQARGAAADPATQLVEAILHDAVSRGASDIHLEPRPDGLNLRLRIDGVLHEKANFKARLPAVLVPRLIRQLKLLAGTDEAETARPRTGGFKRSIEGRQVDFRLATCPMRHGERAVIHVIDPLRGMQELSQLGLSDADEALVGELLAEPYGLIVVSGPPRSGRATTLRAFVGAMNSRERNIITIEKSAEAPIEGINQSQVDPASGYTFAEAVEASRAQDADVIVLAEISNPQTAAAALTAAAEGRMVLAAMHARNQTAATAMLLQIEPEPWTLASTLLAVIATRTLRKLCENCKQQAEPSEELLGELDLSPRQLDCPIFTHGGCSRCSGSGYSGRTGLFSILRVDETIAALLRQNPSAAAIDRAAQKSGMKSLWQAGLQKVRDGITSLEELARIMPHRGNRGT